MRFCLVRETHCPECFLKITISVETESFTLGPGGGEKGMDGREEAVKYNLEVRKLSIMADAGVRCPLTGGCCASQSAGSHWSQQERMRHWETSPQFCSLTALSRKGGTIPKRLRLKYNAQCPPRPSRERTCLHVCACVCVAKVPSLWET